jgi:hypothetical protein
LIGEMPRMEDPSDPVVHLPRGLLLPTNTWATEAEVRELTGEDEEYLARFKDMNDYYDNLIARGTVRIGEQDFTSLPTAERIQQLGMLLIGEREMLMLGIARMTYGDTKTYNMTCPDCEAEFEFDLMITEDIKFKEVEDVQTFSHTFVTKRGTLTYRPLIGQDQMEALKHKGSDAEKNTLLISRAITMVDGRILPDPVGFAKKLSMKDRALFLQKLTDQQPSAEMTLDIPCAACKEVHPSTFAWWDFFRP